jgi:hypothetical protein
MRHISIDLETMGNRPTSAICAIGAVAFDPEADPDTWHSLYMTVDLQSCIDEMLTVDASTIYWWLDQEKDAQVALLGENSHISVALQELRSFYETYCTQDAAMWSHASFDAPILANAYHEVLEERTPWKYRNIRDLRTLEHLTPDVEYPERKGTHHNALDDAMYQAELITVLLIS